jgi:hypothetical protein
MNYNTLDYSFVQKVIYRKVRRNIAWAEYDLQWISFNRKIDFALNRLKEFSFSRLKVIISFWEEYEVIQKILRKNRISNYSLIRNYKRGCKKPGLLEIYFDECLDVNLFRTLIKKHYGYELGKADSLSLDMIFIFENDKDVAICHLYDDRGFHIFYLNQ